MTTTTTETMTERATANLELVRQALTAVETGDLERYEEMLADDFQLKVNGEPAPLDKAMLLGMLRAVRAAMPDMTLGINDVEALDAAGREVRFSNSISGTHTAAVEIPGLAPAPATGNKVIQPRQHATYTIEDGKIVAEHIETAPDADPLSLYKQLGVELPV